MEVADPCVPDVRCVIGGPNDSSIHCYAHPPVPFETEQASGCKEPGAIAVNLKYNPLPAHSLSISPSAAGWDFFNGFWHFEVTVTIQALGADYGVYTWDIPPNYNCTGSGCTMANRSRSCPDIGAPEGWLVIAQAWVTGKQSDGHEYTYEMTPDETAVCPN